MSASFRSHRRHTPQPQDESAKSAGKQSSSRLPTMASSSNTESGKTTQHVSKLAKRSSRSMPGSEKNREQSGASRTPQAPVTAGQHSVPIASRKDAVAPSSGNPSAGHAPLPTLRHLRPLPPPSTCQTPSLVSGSSASTFDSPGANRLRRKATLEERAARTQIGTLNVEKDRAMVQSRSHGHDEVFEDSILGITMPPTTSYGDSTMNVSAKPEPYHGHNSYYSRYRTHTVTPPTTSGYAAPATPSTRYTDSPFSHVPTPSSVSSYSPSVAAVSRNTPQLSQSPVGAREPAVTGLPGKNIKSRLDLPPVRESSTSSSGSTVKRSDPKFLKNRRSSAQNARQPAPKATQTQSNRQPMPPRKDIRGAEGKSPAERLPQQIPPELAHLNVDPPRPSLDKPLPPLRPSREGTPSLTDLQGPFNVVRSDLPPVYTTYHKRTSSQETPALAASHKPKSRFGFRTRSSSREAPPRIDSAVSPSPSVRNSRRDPTPEPRQPERPRLLRKDSPVVGPAASPSKSPRFNLFSRKTPKEFTKPPEKPKREKKRGPAAGTGHEGYGRFGFRGRSGSVATNSTAGRSPSADSNGTSGSSRPPASRSASNASNDREDLDDFLKERLNPVVLRGSGSTGISTLASSSDQTDTQNPPSSTTTLDSLATPQLLPSALKHQERSGSPLRRARPNIANQCDSSEDDTAARYPSLAARRSYNRLNPEDKAPPRMPPPISTKMPAHNEFLSNHDADESAIPNTGSTIPDRETRQDESFGGKEGLWLRFATPQPRPLPKPTNKWNFFERAHSSPRDKRRENSVVMSDREWHAAYQTSRNAGRYPMIDTMEPVGLDEVEQMLGEAETSDERSSSDVDRRPQMIPYDRGHSSLLPSPPKSMPHQRDSALPGRSLPKLVVPQESQESPELLRARMAKSQRAPHMVDIPRSPKFSVSEDSTDTHLHFPEIPQGYQMPAMARDVRMPDAPRDTDSPKPSRLSPVGRIPMVVSRRDRDRKLSDNSFSRPFARNHPKPSVKPPGSLYSQIRDLASPVENTSQPVSSTSGRSDAHSAEQKSSVNTEQPSLSTNRTSADMHDFFTFPRKGSEQSNTNSSDSSNFYTAKAMQAQHEDIWHEYNDLMDDVDMQKKPNSARSSLGAPFQYAHHLQDDYKPSVPETPQYYAQTPWGMPISELPPPQRASTVPAVLAVPQQITRFLQPSLSPLTTPNSLADFVSDYGNRSSQSVAPMNRSSTQQGRRGSVDSSRCSIGSHHSRASTVPEGSTRHSVQKLTSATNRRKSQLEGIAEHDNKGRGSPSANLRYGALMTSKWLSFGRVLFSPAHNEMRLADEPRVLILDGLGDDWSSYVAFSYPTATIYNLGSPTANKTPTTRPPLNWNHLPNLRHIRHPHLAAPFPFPKAFFTAAVLRFPLATTDPAYQSCITECKRVLRPGGHLEATVLDLDPVNMGPRCRRAIQGLKIRIQQRDAGTSLRNLSDGLVRLIGRRGFEDVQRCVVGIPAAGRIPRGSRDLGGSGHSNSGSSDSSGRGKAVPTAEPRQFSFADLLDGGVQSTFGSGKADDEGITKMVARVGRWWFESCYESAAVGGAETESARTTGSIWNDRAILRECERQGTSFRLLICCAQKPLQVRRRTVSV